jgi:hypothetical protein
MIDTLFISEAQFRARGLIAENIEFRQVRPIILDVQNIQIQNLLGYDLFEDLKQAIDTDSLNSVERVLIENYLQLIIINYTQAELLITNTFKMTAKGTINQYGTYDSIVSADDINRVSIEYKNKAKSYEKQAVDYINRNKNNFALYQWGQEDKQNPIKPFNNFNIYFKETIDYDKEIKLRQKFCNRCNGECSC